MNIPINSVNLVQNSIASSQKANNNSIDFADFLNNAINSVNKLQLEAEHQNNLLAIGELDNPHQLTIASSKAEAALQLTLNIRNKVLDAYNEIMRMQI